MSKFRYIPLLLIFLLFTGAIQAQDTVEPIRIGVLASLTGPFAQLGADGVDGVNLAIEEFGGQIAGRPIELYIEDDAADPNTSIEKTRALVNRDNVEIVLGPLSGSAGEAVKNNADEWPDTTIIVAGAAAEDITMRGVKPNVWRTSYTGAQPMFPLGDWAYANGYETVVTIAEDYAFPYAQVGGFMHTFCAAGGHVPQKFWVPIGTSDYSSIFPQIPQDVDAIYVALGGTDAVNFVTQMDEYGLLGDIPFLGGTVTIDAAQLASVGDLLDGVVSGSIMTGDLTTPEFKSLDERFGALRGRAPSLFVENYYRATKWALLALQRVYGNVEDQEAYRAALQATSFVAPASFVYFDDHHNVMTDIYLNQVKNINGEWRNSVISVYPMVSQFWTDDPAEYESQPPYSRDFPSCP